MCHKDSGSIEFTSASGDFTFPISRSLFPASTSSSLALSIAQPLLASLYESTSILRAMCRKRGKWSWPWLFLLFLTSSGEMFQQSAPPSSPAPFGFLRSTSTSLFYGSKIASRPTQLLRRPFFCFSSSFFLLLWGHVGIPPRRRPPPPPPPPISSDREVKQG